MGTAASEQSMCVSPSSAEMAWSSVTWPGPQSSQGRALLGAVARHPTLTPAAPRGASVTTGARGRQRSKSRCRRRQLPVLSCAGHLCHAGAVAGRGGGACRSPQRREQVWRVSTGSKVTRHLCPLFFGPATSHGHLRAGKGRLPRSGPRAQDPPQGWHWWPPWSVACWSIPIIAFPSPSLFQDFSSPSFLSYNYSMTIVGT